MGQPRLIDDRDLDTTRDRPSTLMYCDHCDDHVLRSEWPDHEDHHIEATDSDRRAGHIDVGTDTDTDEDDEEDNPRPIGGEYTVRLDYNATHSFTVVAGHEQAAIEKAKDMVEWGTAGDGHHLHTDVDERRTIHEDDPEAEEHDLGL